MGTTRQKPSLATDARSSTGYVLRLFVVGNTLISARAIVNLRTFCEKYLNGNYELEIVDLSKYPERAKSAQIVASPTLVKTFPRPVRHFIGDMSQTARLLDGLELAS